MALLNFFSLFLKEKYIFGVFFCLSRIALSSFYVNNDFENFFQHFSSLLVMKKYPPPKKKTNIFSLRSFFASIYGLLT